MRSRSRRRSRKSRKPRRYSRSRKRKPSRTRKPSRSRKRTSRSKKRKRKPRKSRSRLRSARRSRKRSRSRPRIKSATKGKAFLVLLALGLGIPLVTSYLKLKNHQKQEKIKILAKANREKASELAALKEKERQREAADQRKRKAAEQKAEEERKESEKNLVRTLERKTRNEIDKLSENFSNTRGISEIKASVSKSITDEKKALKEVAVAEENFKRVAEVNKKEIKEARNIVNEVKVLTSGTEQAWEAKAAKDEFKRNNAQNKEALRKAELAARLAKVKAKEAKKRTEKLEEFLREAKERIEKAREWEEKEKKFWANEKKKEKKRQEEQKKKEAERLRTTCGDMLNTKRVDRALADVDGVNKNYFRFKKNLFKETIRQFFVFSQGWGSYWVPITDDKDANQLFCALTSLAGVTVERLQDKKLTRILVKSKTCGLYKYPNVTKTIAGSIGGDSKNVSKIIGRYLSKYQPGDSKCFVNDKHLTSVWRPYNKNEILNLLEKFIKKVKNDKRMKFGNRRDPTYFAKEINGRAHGVKLVTQTRTKSGVFNTMEFVSPYWKQLYFFLHLLRIQFKTYFECKEKINLGLLSLQVQVNLYPKLDHKTNMCIARLQELDDRHRKGGRDPIMNVVKESKDTVLYYGKMVNMRGRSAKAKEKRSGRIQIPVKMLEAIGGPIINEKYTGNKNEWSPFVEWFDGTGVSPLERELMEKKSKSK